MASSVVRKPSTGQMWYKLNHSDCKMISKYLDVSITEEAKIQNVFEGQRFDLHFYTTLMWPKSGTPHNRDSNRGSLRYHDMPKLHDWKWEEYERRQSVSSAT